MNEIASRACSARSTRGTMIPCAPRSSARPIRSRSPDCGRTKAAVVVVPVAWSWPSRSDSVPAPCSRSMISQSNPARAISSVATADPSPTNEPIQRLAGAEPVVEVDETGDGRRGESDRS